MKAHIIVTTTHHINPRVRSLANELARALPDAVRINRGKQNIINLAEKARLYEAKSVLIVGRGLYGNPGRVTFLSVLENRFFFYPLIITFSGVKLAREQKAKIPSVSLEKFSVVVKSSASEDARELALSISEALQLNYAEIDDYKSFIEVFQRLLIVEKSPDKNNLIIKFINPSGRIEGPFLKIKKVVYKPPF
ncbi:MAG: hypothetical protein B6U95_04485 [Thermofilum sp. ex4484_82]|nr:MAG: hypothetical protein B6U95_04485 [Thermofilum sp. ex4484_82]OYT38444.1 MAG: hypothetical protein B6U96_04480 [Archaeoglobales archaeon ex4484_92]RLE74807.1 MAG: hypothetical protein DRZ80_03925 [Thermoprotei archaeon]